ncbi:MAG TPA: UbiA family prenyltransferase [Caulobacteraceae bacterium]|nr:UbiA family prenyltransferase [Caulobacteraceae bacterium]
MTILPDAARTNWVDRYAPAGLRPWLKLGRLDRPNPMWLLILPGWQGAALLAASRGWWPDPVLLAKILLGAALMRAAGCAYNDIVDADIDAKVARTAGRPIPSGQISKKGAWAFLVGCSLLALAILLSLNVLSVLLGVGSLGLVAAYPFMKRITWWPQAWLGLTFNWGALLGYAAAQGGRPAAETLLFLATAWSKGVPMSLVLETRMGLDALLLYASGIFWTLGYDTIYAVQDLEDDALAGVKSSARRLGVMAPQAVLAFYAVTVFLALGAWWAGHLGPLAIPLIGLYGLHLARQAPRLDLNDPAGALALFKSNTLAGLVLFAALVVGRWKIGLFG